MGIEKRVPNFSLSNALDRQWVQIKPQEITPEHIETLFHYEDGQTLA